MATVDYVLPTESRARRSVTALQGALTRVLQEHRLSEINVAQLCREAGIHRTTFYGHFSSIEQLARATYADTLNELMDVPEPAEHAQDADLKAAYEENLRKMLRHVAADRRAYRRLLGPDGDASLVAMILEVTRRRARDSAAEWRRRGHGEGIDPDLEGAFIGSALYGALEYFMEHEDADLDDTVAAVVRLLPAAWP